MEEGGKVRWMRTEEEDEHPVDGWMDAEICERERERERASDRDMEKEEPSCPSGGI